MGSFYKDGYVVYNRKPKTKSVWYHLRAEAESEVMNIASSLSSVEVDYSPVAEYLLNLSHNEREKEKKLIEDVLGEGSVKDINDIQSFIEKFNTLMQGEKQFAAAKKRLDEAIKRGENKNNKDRAPTVASLFTSYFHSALSKRLKNFLEPIKTSQGYDWKAKDWKQYIERVYDDCVDEAVRRMFSDKSKENLIYGENGDWDAYLKAYNEMDSLRADFKQMIRSRLDIKELGNMLKNKDNREMLDKKRNNKSHKGFSSLIAKTLNLKSEKNVRSIAGFVEEFVVILGRQIGDGKNKGRQGKVLSSNVLSADSVTLFNINIEAKPDFNYILNQFDDQLRKPKSLLDASRKINKFYDEFAPSLQDITIVYDSTKSYSMSGSFSKHGFGGGTRKLVDAEEILNSTGEKDGDIHNLINVLLNSMEGAILNSKSEQYKELFKQKMVKALAQLMFDDWSTIGDTAGKPNAIHVFTLDGIQIPLSVLLEATGKAIEKTQNFQEARQYFNVHTSLGEIKYKEPIEMLEGSDDKHFTYSKILEAWNIQLEEARTKATFSISFLRNFKDEIKNWIKF